MTRLIFFINRIHHLKPVRRPIFFSYDRNLSLLIFKCQFDVTKQPICARIGIKREDANELKQFVKQISSGLEIRDFTASFIAWHTNGYVYIETANENSNELHAQYVCARNASKGKHP